MYSPPLWYGLAKGWTAVPPSSFLSLSCDRRLGRYNACGCMLTALAPTQVIFAIKDDSLEDSLKLLANDTDLSLDQIEEVLHPIHRHRVKLVRSWTHYNADTPPHQSWPLANAGVGRGSCTDAVLAGAFMAVSQSLWLEHLGGPVSVRDSIGHGSCGCGTKVWVTPG